MSNQAKIFYGITLETIIYRLVVRNYNFDNFLKNIIFLAGRNGQGRHCGAKGSGLQDPTKNLAQWVDLFGQPLSRKYCSKISGLNPPNMSLAKNAYDLLPYLE